MASGYTAGVQDGTITEFGDFAMRCARAFGALVVLRDESVDAKIPKELKASTSHYDEQERAARAELGKLEATSQRECAKLAADDHEKAMREWTKAEKRRATERSRYEAMLAKVRAWSPPTPDHQGLRDFMLEQLGDSIRWDCGGWEQPKRLEPGAWKADRIKNARRDLVYAIEEREKEIERTKGGNEWLQRLRDSLEGESR